MHAGNVNFVRLSLLLVLCHSAPLPLAVGEHATLSLVGDSCKFRTRLESRFQLNKPSKWQRHVRNPAYQEVARSA